MSSNSSSNKFTFMTSDFKGETPKVAEAENTSNSKVVDKPVKDISIEDTPQAKPESQEKTNSEVPKSKQKSSKKPPAKNKSSKGKNDKKTSTPAVSIKSSENGEVETVGKRSDPNYKTVGIMLPVKAHKRAKILLMDDPEERDFSDLMTDLLQEWLAEQSL